MFKIQKKTGSSLPGRLAKERLIIKSFKTMDAAHNYMEKQNGYSSTAGTWTYYTGDLKPGTYAFAGGAWHNVKTLDSSVLAHI